MMNKQKEKVLDIIKEFCEDNDLEYVDDYSGRCMYGRTCIGIVGDDMLTELVNLCDRLHDEEINSAYDSLGCVYMDNMGRQSIIYFPNLSKD